MKIYKPTDTVQKVESIFLAGTIDMGNSEDWQSKVITCIELLKHDISIFNPRRDDWDSSWKQEMSDPQFNHQVNWELSCLAKSDLVVMYFGKDSASPISLLELGLFKHKVICYCPDGFYRKGNVDIVGSIFDFPIFTTFEDLIEELNKRLRDKI